MLLSLPLFPLHVPSRDFSVYARACVHSYVCVYAYPMGWSPTQPTGGILPNTRLKDRGKLLLRVDNIFRERTRAFTHTKERELFETHACFARSGTHLTVSPGYNPIVVPVRSYMYTITTHRREERACTAPICDIGTYI